ncbi:MAG: serine acetyltransferase [Coprobacillus sp.]|nr:serine acetyltransferase [Coprobacillus sp.]MDY4145454.1 serine O-acetyltransferase EpsC [Bacilli bacterium]
MKEIINELKETNFKRTSKAKRDEVIDLLNQVRYVLFPNFYEKIIEDEEDYFLRKLLTIKMLLRCNMDATDDRESKIEEFIKSIPTIKKYLEMDVETYLKSDPAAESAEEIILSYPGLYAISVYRIAHELYKLNVPNIPRIMTEEAHTKTGIDIHPGASIDDHFFIDHGTGIVIGETTSIGSHVKVYQGVTLGAIAINDAEKLKGVKRHPTIKNNVTIYSGACILGGNTVINDNVIIGCNAFITKSIEANQTIIYNANDFQIKNKN